MASKSQFESVALVAVPTISRDAIQAVVAIKVRLKVAPEYTHTVHLRRDAEPCGMRADIRRMKTRALETLPVSLLVAKASKRCETLCMTSVSIQSASRAAG
jgi:hypothetical protein